MGFGDQSTTKTLLFFFSHPFEHSRFLPRVTLVPKSFFLSFFPHFLIAILNIMCACICVRVRGCVMVEW